MNKWRLLHDKIDEPFLHFAVEEALLRGMDENTSPPILRIRQTKPSVWIGVYQYPEEDVDILYCEQKNIKIVRRPNPGGAVYQDEGSFCYSLFFPKKNVFERLQIQEPGELYKLAGNAVIETCKDFGVIAGHSPVNDITINGRKVYGSAQIEFYSAFVHSGTFLVNTNLDEMERCLIPSKLKFIDKGFKNVKDRVINLSEAIGERVEVPQVIEKLVFHLSRILEMELYKDDLFENEILLANQLFEEKYSKPEWTFREKASFNTVVSTKSPSGIITLCLSTDNGKVTDIEIKGDFVIANQDDLRKVIHSLIGQEVKRLPFIIKNSPLPIDLKESLASLLLKIE